MSYFRYLLVVLALFSVFFMPFSVNVDKVGAQSDEHYDFEESGHIHGHQAEYDVFELSEDNFSLEEDVNGDVVVAATDVDISKNVVGDVLVASENFDLNSEISGSLIVLGQNININGIVNGNVYLVGNKISIGTDARILGRTYVGGEEVNIAGMLMDRLYTHAQDFWLSGEVSGNVNISAKEYLIAETAIINGDASFVGETSEDKILGTINGDVKIDIVPSGVNMIAREFLVPTLTAKGILLALFSLYVIVYFLIALWPKTVINLYHDTKTKSLKMIGLGLLWYILVPIAIFFLAATLIGMTFGVAMAGFFIIVLILSQAITGLFIGLKFLERRAVKKSLSSENELSLWSGLFIGITSYVVLIHIPYVRVVILLIGFCYGAGVMASFINSTFEFKK